MLKLISLGTLAAFFFSSTFIINRALSLGGGHWYWNGSLRYFFMFMLLSLGICAKYGIARYQGTLKIFLRDYKFWIPAGSIGFGLFYSGLCMGAGYLPGWVVATTWQCTIFFTPLTLLFFGRKTPKSALITAVVIFSGVVFINWEQSFKLSLDSMILGILPIVVSAASYPIGNQMIWEATYGKSKLFPRLVLSEIEDPLIKIFLMTLGSIPFWIVIYFFCAPGVPSQAQFLRTFLVAISSGILATSFFYRARHLCKSPFEIAAVDSTQATEVVFALMGEALFLKAPLPGTLGWLGIACILGGQVLFLKLNQREEARLLAS